MKSFTRFFLLFCVLLLTRPLSAHTFQKDDYSSRIKYERSIYAHFSTIQNKPVLIIKSAPSPDEKDHDKREEKISKAENVDEDNEEEQISLKKEEKTIHYFTIFLYPQTQGYLYSYIKNCLSFCKHFSYSSSDTHLVLRVIRI